MVETIEGIVLKTSDYQEKSKILQIFSKEHGLIGIYLKGANQYRSSTFAIAQPISHAFFNIRYTSGLSSSYQGEMITAFQSLKLDFDKNIHVYHLFEILLKNMEQHQPIPYLYQLLLRTLQKINDTNDFQAIKVYTLFYELKLLYFIGVAPVLSNCVECGNQDHIANFDISKGGFVCEKCMDAQSEYFSIEALQTLYSLYHQDFDDLKLNIDEHIIKELRKLVSDFYLYHLNVKTNASKYFT